MVAIMTVFSVWCVLRQLGMVLVVVGCDLFC